MTRLESGQDDASATQNEEFFARDMYREYVAELDSYHLIHEAVTEEVAGIELLLDVGNGGVFEYDTDRVKEIVAVDLFLDRLPDSRFPANVTARKGDALALTEPENTYDAVLEAFLYHHLVGPKPKDMEENTRRAVTEAARVLKPGGRLIVAESCVPRWFYAVELAMFRPLSWLAKTPLLGGHPATIQLTSSKLQDVVAEQLEIERAYRIPAGRWMTQFGRKWPTALTPARPHMIIARKPAA
jgi:SAM-dependent methyltransferase